MSVNKVEFADEVLIDISDSTVTAEKLLKDETAYGADGEQVTGTLDVEAQIDAAFEEILNGEY